jgi:hypothetical protein
VILRVKLQGGKELLDQPWTIILFDDHKLVQPHLLSDPQSISKILILGQELNVYILHGAYLGEHGCIDLLIDPLKLEAVEVGSSDIPGQGVELLTMEFPVFLL